jgi:iron(III) transport system substrate-binding protein
MKRLALLLLLGACTPEPPPMEERPEPVVVYAAFENVQDLSTSFERYQEETGVTVVLRRGSAATIVNDVIANEVLPPADLLITRSVVGAWRAAEESALRPLYSEVVAEHVPDWAADPDRFWYAVAMSDAVVAYAGEKPPVAYLADLGQDGLRGALCLSSSENEVNRAIIAMAISRSGGETRQVELMVRQWVANLAAEPFRTEDELAVAIADGRCGAGLISRSVAERGGLEFLELADQTANIEAVGVGRHARNPDGAARLAEWLITRSKWAANTGETRANVGQVGRHYEDALLLVERARFR